MGTFIHKITKRDKEHGVRGKYAVFQDDGFYSSHKTKIAAKQVAKKLRQSDKQYGFGY